MLNSTRENQRALICSVNSSQTLSQQKKWNTHLSDQVEGTRDSSRPTTRNDKYNKLRVQKTVPGHQKVVILSWRGTHVGGKGDSSLANNGVMYFHWRTDDFGMSAWPWPDCCFAQADCVFYLMIFSSVQVSLILLFRNCQVTSDPAWHLRSVGLLSFLLGIDTVPPCCI